MLVVLRLYVFVEIGPSPISMLVEVCFLLRFVLGVAAIQKETNNFEIGVGGVGTSSLSVFCNRAQVLLN